MVGSAAARFAGGRSTQVARRASLLLLSICGAHRAYRSWRIARLENRAREARYFFYFNERLRFRAVVRATIRLGLGIGKWIALGGTTRSRHSGEPQFVGVVSTTFPRNCARVGARVSGTSRAAEKRPAIAGLQRPFL